MAVIRLSLQSRIQDHQQTHCHGLLQDTNQAVQRTQDKAVTQFFGFDPRSPGGYSKDPATLSDPSIMPGPIAPPVRQ